LICKQRGLSVLEVLIAIIIISVGILALAKLQKNLWHHSSLAKQRGKALILAQGKMEDLRGFEVLYTQTGKFAYQDIVSGSQVVSDVDTSYTVTWNVTDYSDPDYKLVNVSVSWLDNRGNSHNINLTSIISRLDPMETGNVFRD